MKLRYQFAILLGVPLILQLGIVAVLLDSSMKLDSAGKTEANSKEIIAACQDVRIVLVQYLSYFRARQFFDQESAAKRRKDVENVVTEKADRLKFLVKDDRESTKIVADYRQKLEQFERLMSDAGGSIENGLPEVTMTRFIKENELFEEIVVTFNGIGKEEELLIARYRPIVQALQPESIKARDSSRMLLLVGGISDALIVLILALFVGRKTLRRMSVLMNNIDLFSQGDTKLSALEGKDELAELDTKFRKMAEARLKAEEMRRSLVAMVSHDIRSPLTSVGLNISMIMEMHEETLDSKVVAKLRKTDGEIQRLVRLADGLLEIEKIETGCIDLNNRWNDISNIIEPARHAISGIADSKKIKIDISIDGDSAVYCDADRIVQVLVNLMSNAIKFSPANSVLTINVKQNPNSLETRFEVVDQGDGVSQTDEAKLFQKFTQLDQVQELRKAGSGLGLYITRMLVEAHGGTIGYMRPEGGGSCFFFVLNAPVSEDAEVS